MSGLCPYPVSSFHSFASKHKGNRPIDFNPSCIPSSSSSSSSSSRFRCRATFHESSSSSSDSSKPSPFQILGISENSSEEDIKSAFRTKVKEYHPDVYKGEDNAVLITQRLIEAYESLMKQVDRTASKRMSLDPFEYPECEAQEVFVYELNCMGRGCPCSCVERAPSVFGFAPDTGCARSVAQGPPDDYAVQLAVGQCPRNCIYYVTPLQRQIVERIFRRALEGTLYSNEISLLESLLSRAKFENGRYTPPKREAKSSTKWVDWY